MEIAGPGVLPYNDEPGKDPTHEKKISFASCGQSFAVTLQVPLYIWDSLSDSDWDFVEKHVRERADSIRMAAAREGMLLRWQENLQDFARQAVYNQFSKAQLAAGNDSWAAPAGW